jgi:alpha-L-arabinofuranosidase
MIQLKKLLPIGIAILTVWSIAINNVNAQTTKKTCTVDVSKPGAAVAAICRGQQIEEFNHQIEGGLYAQLINNPSFEELTDPILNWNLIKTGTSNASLSTQTSAETKLLNNRQERCIKLAIASVASGSVDMANGGYWGIKLENKTKYRVSFWAKKGSNFNGTISAKLESNEGVVYAQSADFKPTENWQKFTCELTTKGISKVSSKNRFVLSVSNTGDVYFDVVTLMPPTWKNRPNGVRPDLGEKLNGLKLKYMQFPGGCTAESVSMDTCWNWKNSVGPLEDRPGSNRRIWSYKNDLFFGLDEYFQLAYDLGAEPIYTTSSGISEVPEAVRWFAVCPLDKMQPIITDILDLLEYCNGSTSTVWGAKRAANGHPAPYNLKYIEIGNENGMETLTDYIPRYKMIRDAVIARYPNMKIMGNSICHNKSKMSHTNGNNFDFMDEHFYNLQEMQKEKDLSSLYNRYDSIDPAVKKICVAEYASSIVGHGPQSIGTFGDALGDAVFMLGCEKNSERMWWTGYGNYASFVGQCSFGPCIVWNDAVSNFGSPSYYMQKMLFSDNFGTQVLPFTQNTDSCFWSTSIDKASGKNDILLKVANKSTVAETFTINLKGAEKVSPKGYSTTLSSTLNAVNTIEKPNNVTPKTSIFVAGNSFNYTLPANSISVLRIGILK